MKNFLSAAYLLGIIPLAHTHGVEVRQCITPTGSVRFFIEHWHGNLGSPSAAGTMRIRSEVTTNTTEFTIGADAVLNNRDAYAGVTGWGCVNDAVPTISASCSSGGTYNDWVYFDRPATCNVPVRYTLLRGNSVTLLSACGGSLYPAVIDTVIGDTSAPVPLINGNTLPFILEGSTTEVDPYSGIVTFTPTAQDDCDPNPNCTTDIASGSVFPLGDTQVTVTATDNTGKTTTGVLTVRMTRGVTSGPSGAPSASPSCYSSKSGKCTKGR